MNLTGSQYLINNNTRYRVELKREIDLLHPASFLSPVSFLNFPRLSLFPVPLSSLSVPLPLTLLACHGVTSYRCLPPPSNCRRLQQRQTAATRARERIDIRTRAHTHARTHTYAHRRGTSPRRVGIQMDTDVTAVARFSTLRSPLAPYSRLRHALRLIHSFSPSLSRQSAISFQGCRW